MAARVYESSKGYVAPDTAYYVNSANIESGQNVCILKNYLLHNYSEAGAPMKGQALVFIVTRVIEENKELANLYHFNKHSLPSKPLPVD